MQVRIDVDIGLEMLMHVQSDVDAGSERRWCRFRELLMQVRIDVDIGLEV